MIMQMHTPIKIDRAEVKTRLRPIDPKSHKGTFGHALIIGGSHGKIGAVCLASKAALKSGCGLVTAFIPMCGYIILQVAIPEVMVITDHNEKSISEIKFKIVPNAIGIGPGMGQEVETQNALHKFLKSNKTQLVIDADALNILSVHKSWLKLIPANSIVTPHQKELERLIGKWKSEKEMLKKAVAFYKQYHLVMVLKGAPTLIIENEIIFENTTGNAALATAGSGDVLTGIITSLVAQGFSTIDSAIIAVFLHGLTATLSLPETGIQSFTASNIIDYLGKAWLVAGK